MGFHGGLGKAKVDIDVSNKTYPQCFTSVLIGCSHVSSSSHASINSLTVYGNLELVILNQTQAESRSQGKGIQSICRMQGKCLCALFVPVLVYPENEGWGVTLSNPKVLGC